MIEVDFLAKRYGIVPSSFLNMSLRNYQFNLLAAQTGIEAESRAAERQRVRGK